MAKTNVEVLSHEALTYLIGIIKRITKVSEAIDDINIKTDGTFSSVKINTLLNTLEQDCNEYTDRLVANLSRLELKLVADEADITKSNIMYLYKPDGATSYNQYVVIDGNKVLLGTCDINMADYYTITQADGKFVLKTDYDSLVDEVDNIKTTIGDSTQLEDDISNEIVALKGKSALKTLTQAQYTELVTNGSVVVDGETITYSDDDYYVISDDSENINLDLFNLKTYTLPSQLGLTNDCTIDNIIQALPVKSSYLGDSATMTNKSQFPTATSDYTFIINKSTTSRYSVIATDKETGKMYTGKVSANSPFTFNGWTKVCTTSVEDVELNNVTDTLVSENATGGTLSYYVKDGICYIELDAITISSISSGGSLSSFYFPVPYLNRRSGYKTIQSWKGNNVLQLSVMSNGKLAYWCESSSIGSIFYGQFSYPVADS